MIIILTERACRDLFLYIFHKIRKQKFAKNKLDKLVLLFYIVLTISILIGQEPPAYFENSRDFRDKHEQIIPRAVRMRNAPLAKEREH